MIIEIAQIDVKPGMEQEFEEGVNQGGAGFPPRQGLLGSVKLIARSRSRPAIGCS